MKAKIALGLAAAVVATVVVLLVVRVSKVSAHTELHSVYDAVAAYLEPDSWNLVIYMDVAACLTCTEDISAWRASEKKITECGGEFVIVTNRADSADVTIAMRLENLDAPVLVLDSLMIEQTKLLGNRIPAKILFDNLGEVKEVTFGSPRSIKQSTKFLNMVADRICSR